MNLFWKRIFGGMTGTAKLERKEADLLQEMERYYQIEASAELAEYKDLMAKVKTPEFMQNKKMLQNRKYTDTEEFRDMKKYEKLCKGGAFKKYLEVLNSSELACFLEFKQTAQYKNLGDPEAVKRSEQLQRMKSYEKSKEYGLYTRFHDSYVEKEYLKLKQQIEDEKFQERVAFWSNPHRWETTPEYKLDARFYELSKNPDIQFYLKADVARFERYKDLKLTFEDNFQWNSLEAARWNAGFHYKSPQLKSHHSFVNEKQANNYGHNTSVIDGILTIQTRKENVKAAAWDQKKGFVEKDFEYTSDIIQSADYFRQAEGVFRAKIRCKGKIHHAFWLGADGKLPHINIFHFNGKNITVGNANQQLFDQTKVTGICASSFYIYTLAWNQKELIWYVNDVEVYRTSANMPNEAMYLAFNSFISENQKGAQGQLEVDWVRVYERK